MSDLDRLFYWHGIASDYINYRGEHVQVSVENRRKLLETMGVDLSSNEAIREAAYQLDVAPWKHLLTPLSVCSADQTAIEINCHPDDLKAELSWTLAPCAGDGTDRADGRATAISLDETGDYQYHSTRYSRRRLPLPSLEIGYYEVTVHLGDKREAGLLAVCPDRCEQPGWLTDQSRYTGIIIQLYTLRSAENWGIGDFTDLKRLVARLAELGIDAVGLNPLHALLPNLHEYCSPYSPSDRRFLNPLYIDVTRVPGFATVLAAMPDTQRQALDEGIEAVRKDPMVDYTRVRELKYGVLKQLFKLACRQGGSVASSLPADMQAFVHQTGATLLQYALFEALSDAGASQAVLTTAMDYDPQGEAFAALVEEHRLAIDFQCFLQWQARLQFDACQAQAEQAGMAVGLIRDLAVGADRSGAEVLSNQHLFCARAAAGAPPDAFASKGQNWGLPPIEPAALRNTAFAHFRALLRANMADCGALRIDHAMGLMRLWWCPPDTTADEGAYICYPFDEMLALLKLESHLNQCAVIGEDLGIVPHNFREIMYQAGVVSNKVFYFERNGPVDFRAPAEYGEYALAMANNHDVPTLTSWWNSDDIRLRARLDCLGDDEIEQDLMASRRQEKANLIGHLQQSDVLPSSWKDGDPEQPADQALVFAVLRWLATTNSRLLVLQLEDLLLMEEPVNVPGTFHEYPNWRRKLSQDYQTLLEREDVAELLQDICHARKTPKDSE